MLNPIEMMFHQLKSIARPLLRQRMDETLTANAHARGMTATDARTIVLMEVATAAISKITSQNCTNYITHMHRELPRAIAMEDM
jgi:hypothetical protein